MVQDPSLSKSQSLYSPKEKTLSRRFSPRKGVPLWLRPDRTALCLSFVFLCSSVTLTSLFFGAGTTPYYVGILGSFALALPALIAVISKPNAGSIWIILLLLVMTTTSLFQTILLTYPHSYPSPLGDTIAKLVLVCWLIAATALTKHDMRISCGMICMIHVLCCLYGILKWSDIAVEDYARMEYGVGTAVWGELALGTIVSGLLSRSRTVLFLANIAAWPVLVATEMRGAGLAAVFGQVFFLYFSSAFLRRHSFKIVFVASTVLFAALANYIDDIIEFVSSVLLLNDQHRGIQSGFSGRFDNWSDGWDLFLGAPIFGVGLGHPIGQYTHNGFLQLLAQYGLLSFISFVMFLIISLRRSLSTNRWESAAAVTCLLIFMLTAPRYLNFQIMPFIALMAAANALSAPPFQSRIRQSRRR